MVQNRFGTGLKLVCRNIQFLLFRPLRRNWFETGLKTDFEKIEAVPSVVTFQMKFPAEFVYICVASVIDGDIGGSGEGGDSEFVVGVREERDKDSASGAEVVCGECVERNSVNDASPNNNRFKFWVFFFFLVSEYPKFVQFLS
jgi:hypothetical protein